MGTGWFLENPHAMIFTLFLLTVISFISSIFFVGKSNKESYIFIFYGAGICLYVLYEASVQRQHADWNIRSDLMVIYPLFIIASFKALSPNKKD
jgi:hypothetical protein